MSSETPTSTSNTNITRTAFFRFKPSTTPGQRGNRTRAFLALYKANEHLLVAMPKGGKLLNSSSLDLTNMMKRDSSWDTAFTVTFKSETAREEFDREPGHERLKNETDPLLEEVLVYDIREEENLGW